MTKSRGVHIRYTLAEDRIILAMPQVTTAERERLLPGRSSSSVKQRRSILRAAGVTLETVSAYHHRPWEPEPDPPNPQGMHLNEFLVWEIVKEMHQSDGERRSWSQLARDLRIPRATVASQVQWLRDRGGWFCPLTHTPCRVCGEVVIGKAWGPPVTTHRQCMPTRKAEALREWAEPIQEETRTNAVHHRQRWTIAEDRYILDHWDDRAEDVAKELNRTLYAINQRRHALRKRYTRRNLAI